MHNPPEWLYYILMALGYLPYWGPVVVVGGLWYLAIRFKKKKEY